MVSAFDEPRSNSPLANMPALTGIWAASSLPTGLGRSTYTSAERVCGSTVGAIMRTLPLSATPLAATTVAAVPALRRPSSLEVTSARHSSRPPRIMRKSSVPAPTTAPTVAVRAEMTPLSGASNWVCFSRTCCTARVALAASRRALAVFSAVMYWLICCSLRAPLACSVRAFSALPAASSALASASAMLARPCATSAWTDSSAKTASTWPARTVSPTLARTSVNRRPLASLPMRASCQAVMLPLADSLMGRLVWLGNTVVTVSAGLGVFFFSSAAPDFVEKMAVAPNPRAAIAIKTIATGLRLSSNCFIRVMGQGACWGGTVAIQGQDGRADAGMSNTMGVAGGAETVQPPPSAR